MTNSTVKIVSVGDIFLGEHPFTLGHGVASVAKEQGSDFLFENIQEHLEGDIVCGNLEGIISEKKNGEDKFQHAIFWGQPDSAKSLAKSGFNCIFLANNHTAQHGRDALERTCTQLNHNNIKWTGYNPESPDISTPALFNINNIKIAFLSYCDTQQYHLDKPILPIINIERIKSDITQLKRHNDIIIVSMHWGDEFIEYPSPTQMNIAHEIIDSGASIILGHHSHSMQGIEKYNEGLIVYSQGSFIKDLWRQELRESIILEVDINKNGIKDFSFTPIYINNQYQPELYSGDSCAFFINKLETLSKNIQKNLKLDQNSLKIQYEKEVQDLEKMDKLDNLKHYIKYIFRYNKKLLIENIMLILKRRLYRKNI